MKNLKKSLLFLILISLTQEIYSQTAISIGQIREMNNTELMQLIDNAKQQNISMLELIELAESQGATTEELNLIRDLFQNELQDNTNKEERNKDNISTDLGDLETSDNIKSDIKNLRFGSEFFNNDKIVESPQLFISTPKEYVLGPGDEILIELYGASNATYDVQVSREGNIKIDRLAPIYISGLTMDELQDLLKVKFSKIYSGLNSTQNFQKVMLSVTLAKARSIIINIIGQVNFPGTYTVPGFTSVLNALFISGGPNEIGSYRKISIIREGKIINTIDLYDYFVGGIYPNFFLRDQDVIQVNAYEKLIEVNEGFKISNIFELKSNENFQDILKYTGGFLSNYSKSNIYISRFLENKSKLFEFNQIQYKTLNLSDGDKISLKEISDDLINSISISGEVYLPGVYPYYEDINLEQLVKNAGGFKPDAFKSNISVLRKYQLTNPEIFSVNESDLNLKLERKDSVIVYNKKSFTQFKEYLIVGEVNSPGSYTHYNNLRLNEVIAKAGGLTSLSNSNNIKIYRNKSSSNTDKASLTVLNLKYDAEKTMNYDENIEIKNMDIIVVPKIDDFIESEYVELKGFVKVEGIYGIKNNFYTVDDLIKDAGGLGNFADINSIYVQRKNTDGDEIFIPFNKKSNPILKNRDIIFVGKKVNTVSVFGEVFNPIQIEYRNGLSLKKLLSLAGGLNDNANLRKAYYINSDNTNSKVKSFLFFRYLGKDFKEGSSLIIPEKTKKNNNNRSIADVLSISSALASLVALIQIIK